MGALSLAPCLFLCWGSDDSSCRGQAARFTMGTLLTSLKIGDYWGSCDHVRGDADEKLGPRFAANAQKALCRKLEMCGAPEALGTTCNGGVWAMPFG